MKKYKYDGKPITLIGEEGQNEIIPFQHTDLASGRTETIGLRLNETYVVGGQDACGNVIKDWVYETYMTSEYNNMRVKSKTEIKRDAHLVRKGTVDFKLSEILE